MNIQNQVKEYINCLPDQKRSDMQALHHFISKIMSETKLWFLDGKNEKGKTVSNPNIGYGSRTNKYKNGKTNEFYQIGLSANTTGISVYIMGINDKTYLKKKFGDKIGKANVTGYCIKFKSLRDIHPDVLETAIRYGIKNEN